MMFRTVYVLPTILGLLVAGPVHCVSATPCVLAECASDESAGSPHACGGCSHPGPEPAHRVQPEPDEPAPACTMDVCRGSLSATPRRLGVEYRLLLSFASAAVVPGTREVGASSEVSAGAFPDTVAARPAAGRELCIAICSFLL